jgi:hypothetical protein
VPRLPHTYSLPAIFRKAWGIARHHAKHQGGSPRAHIAAALRQAWAEAKATAQRIAEKRERVLACVAEMRFQQSEIGRARHEKLVAECSARAEAGVARANEIVRRLTQPAVRRAAA